MSAAKFTLSWIVFSFLMLFNQNLQAQQNATDTVGGVSPIRYWDTKSSIALNFSQVSLSNWAGGGESSISISSLVNLNATYSRGSVIWENRLDVAYGLIRQGDTPPQGFRKTDDLLNLLTKYNYRIKEELYITALADYRTQMTEGFRFEENEDGVMVRKRISDFMAPGFLVTSLGLTYKKPKNYSVTLSPFTGKFTFVLDDSLSNAGAFGVEPGQRLRSEAGAALNSNFQRTLYTNVDFQTSLNLFAGYQSFSHVDVNWEGVLFLKVNRYIKSSVSAQLIYDHDIIQKTQWRNVINVGFLLEM